MATVGGRKILAARRAKAEKLTVSDEPRHKR